MSLEQCKFQSVSSFQTFSVFSHEKSWISKGMRGWVSNPEPEAVSSCCVNHGLTRISSNFYVGQYSNSSLSIYVLIRSKSNVVLMLAGLNKKYLLQFL